MATRQEIQALRTEIQTVVARGKRAQKALQKAGKSHVRGLFTRVAEEENVSEAQLRQSVTFAATFSSTELKFFMGLRTPSGKPLRISVAYQIMYVPSAKLRRLLATLAAKHDWSSRQVKAEVIRRVGVDEKASKGGRRPPRPTTRAEALDQIEHRSDQWPRWVSRFQATGEEPDLFLSLKLPVGIRSKILAVTDAMRKLVFAVRARS